jgi:hypothetical protein
MAPSPWAKAKEDSVRNLLLGRCSDDNSNGGNMNDSDGVLVRSAMKKACMAESHHSTDSRRSKLQVELNEATVKHSETVYWLQLELNTTRQAKEALEDRIAEIYGDMQGLEKPRKPRPTQPDAAYAMQQQKQIEKYERMLKILNKQIGLVRTSADSLVKNLKDEIKDLMDDKVQNELKFMNKLSALDSEMRNLEQQLVEEKRKKSNNSQNQSIQPGHADGSLHLIPVKQLSVVEVELGEHSESPTAPASFPIRETAPPKPPCRHKSIEYDDPTPLRSPRRQKSSDDDIEATIEHLYEDMKRLRAENKRLREQLHNQEADETVISETEKLSAQVEDLKTKNKSLEMKLIDARSKAHESLVQWTREKAALEEQIDSIRESKAADGAQEVEPCQSMIQEALDRVALLWDSANESIRSVESAMAVVRPDPSQDAERTLSVFETASIVNEQIKLSLMVIELQFRNRLRCLGHDHSSTRSFVLDGDSKALNDKVKQTQDEAMESIGKVGSFVEEQIQVLRVKFEEEALALREMQEARAVDLRQSLDRQTQLEKEISRLKSGKTSKINAPSAVEMLVSQKAMETLQREVLLIVERVKEKNETIGRLSAEIEEHKVRERTLMEELKRHMKDQTDRQMAEQQRLMAQHAQHESSESEGASTSSEYEERTVEETVYDEITVED